MAIIPKSITLPSNLMKKLLIKLLAGLLPRARGAFARPAGQQTHTAQLRKVLYFFWLVIRPIDQQINFIAVNIFRFKFVDVEAIGESCPKLQNLRLSRILSFCNTHSPRWSQKFINIPEVLTAHCQDLLNVTNEMLAY